MCAKARGKKTVEIAEMSRLRRSPSWYKCIKIFARNRVCVSVSGEVAIGPVPAETLFPPIQLSRNASGRFPPRPALFLPALSLPALFPEVARAFARTPATQFLMVATHTRLLLSRVVGGNALPGKPVRKSDVQRSYGGGRASYRFWSRLVRFTSPRQRAARPATAIQTGPPPALRQSRKTRAAISR